MSHLSLAVLLLVVVAAAAVWWPSPRLSLSGLAGTWRADAAAMPAPYPGIGAADRAALAAWRESELRIATGCLRLRLGGVERVFAASEGRSGDDVLSIMTHDGLSWTLHRHDDLLLVFTGTRAGSVAFRRVGD